ncbi:hypothetical protein HDE_04510 [Halotydeus destructor]|nr:hypothetical protein HDE_04510 [Halotydeus destructor]
MKVSALVLLVLAAAIFVSVGAQNLRCPPPRPGQVGICVEECNRVNTACTAPNGRKGICCVIGCGHTCYTG